VLVTELRAFKVKITAAANETFESWRERDHDDLVLAVALACWLGQRIPVPERGRPQTLSYRFARPDPFNRPGWRPASGDAILGRG
jgi:hypothetical protein